MKEDSPRDAIAGGLAAARERVRLLEGVWVPSLAVALLAVALPWFLRTVALDLAPLAWGVFLYALVHLASAAAIDRLTSVRALLVAAQALHLVGILFLAVAWHLAGGVDNPAFLLAFVLPVVASGVVMRKGWAVLAALVSVAAVSCVALLESAELRWYLVQLGLPLGPLLRALPLAGRPEPFPGLVRPPVSLFVLLEAFAVLQLAAALVSQWLASGLLRIHGRASSVAALEEAQSLFHATLKKAGASSALVETPSGEVVEASDGFVKRMLLHGESLRGRRLFDLVSFDEADRVSALLHAGGEALFCAYAVGSERRVARVRVERLEHAGASYALVSFEDLIDVFYLRAAFDAVDDPLLVLGPDERLRYANRAAEGLFGALHFGMEAVAALAPPPLAEGWWRDGTGAEGERRLEVGGRVYRAARLAARPEGAGEVLTILRLQREPS